MNAYSKDLRLRVLGAVERGLPREELSELFGVSRSTIKRWVSRRREGEDLEPKRSGGRKRRSLSSAEEERRALWAGRVGQRFFSRFGGKGKRRASVSWPESLRALRAWLEPWVMLWRYWRAFSEMPPPSELKALLERVFSGRGLCLYVR